MSQNRSRFVLLCQQALACAVVVAVAAPAAGVVDLDIVAPPSAPAGGSVGAAGSGTASVGSLVASEPVKPVVTEVPITDAHGLLVQSATKIVASQRLARTVDSVRPASAGRGDRGPGAALSLPEQVRGFATVGVTWDHADHLDDDEITVSVRSLQAGTWSDWQELPYDADHGPDPGSAEARGARNGTDAVVVGDVDDVQVRAVTADGATLPDDMSLAIVDPGETVAAVREKPAIDTARLASADTVDHRPDGPSTRDRPDGAHRPGGPHRAGGPGRPRRRARRHAGRRHPAAADLLPCPVGRRRADARQELAALLRGARRLRAPHRQRQRLHQGRGALDPARHLRLPHPVPRLERHRLQLPRRPVRPDLGGPVRRCRPPRRRRAHPELQRERVRDVGDRQLRHHPARRRDAAGLRAPLRVEAQPARHRRLVEAAVGARPLATGDQRPPRRRQDRVPGEVPLRQDPADQAVRRRRPASVHQPRQGQRPRRHPLAGPRRPREGHQQGLRRAHRRPGRLRPGDHGDDRMGRHGPGRRDPGRHRRRHPRHARAVGVDQGDRRLPRRRRGPLRRRDAHPDQVRRPRPARRRRRPRR